MSLKSVRNYLEDIIGLDPETVGIFILDKSIKKHMDQCKITSHAKYLSMLRASEEKTEELIELAVINESWFFRQSEAFKCIESKLQHRKRDRVRVLSLGCASGEEPYSAAMTLLDHGLTPDQFVIDAVDVSKKTLNAAKEGEYKPRSFMSKDLAFRDHYFTANKETYTLRPMVRNCVNFIQGNILSLDKTPLGSSYDFIFCRNLFIYLCKNARSRLMDQINRLLAADGTVLVGSSESHILRHDGYTSAGDHSAFAFTKERVADPKTIGVPAIIADPPISPEIIPEKTESPARPEKTHRPMPLDNSKTASTPQGCWQIDGTAGNRSCEKLSQYIHCSKCPERIKHGQAFFDRTPPEDYLIEWKDKLSESEAFPDISDRQQIVVFRIGTDLFAIPSRRIVDITGTKEIHKIPFKSNDVFLGTANFSGELRLCVSIHKVLTQEQADDIATDRHKVYKRMLTIIRDNSSWAFHVEEIIAVKYIYSSSIKAADASATYSLGSISLEDQQVHILDHHLLCSSFERSVQ